MRFIILFLLLAVPTNAISKVYRELRDSSEFDFKSAGGMEAMQEILLPDGSRMWTHGCDAGAKVTSGGVTALGGEYPIKDSVATIKVGENGNLLEPLYNIKSNMIRCRKQ